jgi:hypothetical protein
MADSYAESVVRISDDSSGDFIEGEDGKRRPDWENVQRSRLRADNRKWFAARLSSRYREKQGVELSTTPGEPMEIRSGAPTVVMTPEEVALEIRNMLTEAEIAIGLPPSDEAEPVKDRLHRILSTGEPVPPNLYTAIMSGLRTDGVAH